MCLQYMVDHKTNWVKFAFHIHMKTQQEQHCSQDKIHKTHQFHLSYAIFTHLNPIKNHAFCKTNRSQNHPDTRHKIFLEAWVRYWEGGGGYFVSLFCKMINIRYLEKDPLRPLDLKPVLLNKRHTIQACLK